MRIALFLRFMCHSYQEHPSRSRQIGATTKAVTAPVIDSFWDGVGSTTWAAVLALAMLPVDVTAQIIFRSVDSKGRTSFSDVAPSTRERVSVLNTRARGGSSWPEATTRLPPELARAVERAPARLIVGADCGRCASARAFLKLRGIPFNEMLVSSLEDLELFRNAHPEVTLPALELGTQAAQGYSPKGWGRQLAAAGYPEKSLLPSQYRFPPPVGWALPRNGATAARPVQAAAPDTEPTTQQIPAVNLGDQVPVLVPTLPSDNPNNLKF
jgi:hypothetical protein